MAIENLIAQINNYVKFSDSELKIIETKFKFNKFKAKQNIVSSGQICSDIHFIYNGLVRVFYLKDGNEITTYLCTDNGFVSSYPSFINQTKSYHTIQCLEDTQTLSINYQDMHQLYQTIPQWQTIGRIFSEQNVICYMDRVAKLQAIPAKEKYLDFLKTTPEKIITRTPLIHIASYLGIKPESLSRIRKEIS